MSSTYKLTVDELEQEVEHYIKTTDNWKGYDLRVFVEKLCKKHEVSDFIADHLMEEAFDLFHKRF